MEKGVAGIQNKKAHKYELSFKKNGREDRKINR